MPRPLLVALALLGALAGAGCRDRPALGSMPAAGALLPARYTPRMTTAAADLEAIRGRVAALPADLDGLDVAQADVAKLGDELTRAGAAVASWPRELAAAIATGQRPVVARALEQFHTTVGGPLVAFERQLPHSQARVAALERAAASDREAAAALAAVTFTATLPGGATVSGARDGFEHAALGAFAEPERPIAPARWPDGWQLCDRIVFGGADGERLEQGKSKTQLQNLARLLAAFPDLRIEVAGTGADGEAPAAVASRKAARRRADAVVAALVASGAPATRLSARRGPEHDLCPPPPAPVDPACVAQSRAIHARLVGP